MVSPIQNPVVQGPKAIIEGFSGNLADVDSSGALKVNVTSGGSGSNASVAPTGATAPTSATLVGGSESGVLQPIVLDPSGNLNVNVQASVTPTGIATSAKQDTGNTSLASIDTKTPALSSGRVPVDGSGVVQPVSATGLPLPTGAATSANQTNGSQTTQVTNFPATQPVSAVSLPLPTNAAIETGGHLASIDTKLTNPLPVSGTLTTTPPANASTNITEVGGATLSEGQKTMSASVPVAIASDQTALPENLTQIAGTNLGTPTNFGTTPGAVVAASANVSLFIGTTVATAASAGVLKVGISGNAGGTLDSTLSPAGSPARGLGILGMYNTGTPALTNGQTASIQCDNAGSVFVKPYRRSSTVAQSTTIASSSAATTVLAAQAAGVFADISSLVITATPALTTALVFTATLSDGTTSYIFDMDTGTVAASSGPIVLSFPVPIPATSAATAWTIALSVATVTVHITAIAVLQKAS